jgi:hypothetical protein
MRTALDELGADALVSDPATGTVWSSRSVQDLPDIPLSWSVNPYHPTVGEQSLKLQRRAKAVLDPTGKLAPDAFTNLTEEVDNSAGQAPPLQ